MYVRTYSKENSTNTDSAAIDYDCSRITNVNLAMLFWQSASYILGNEKHQNAYVVYCD